jgi:hypothetical protein
MIKIIWHKKCTYNEVGIFRQFGRCFSGPFFRDVPSDIWLGGDVNSKVWAWYDNGEGGYS